MIVHPVKELRRELAAYYTPNELGSLLAEFSLRSGNDSLLEPSFGGGGLLVEGISRLTELGSQKPISQVHGCDIDGHAFENLSSVVGKKYGKQSKRFVKADFLSLDKSAFMTKKFDAVMANPPYIGYRKMSKTQKLIAKQITQDLEIKNARYAGTWYYFLLKSFTFLKEGGRLAFVLPYALIDSNYSSDLREFISKHFNKSVIFAFSERLFVDQGTREKVVVLLAEGWAPRGLKQRRLDAISVDSIETFRVLLKKYRAGETVGNFLGSDIGNVKGKINNKNINLLNTLRSNRATKTIGEYLDVRIGLVAGDIKYFTFNNSKLAEYSLSKSSHVIPVLRSLRDCKGLSFNEKDFNEVSKKDKNTYLLDYNETLLKDQAYLSYINEYSDKARKGNKTFNSREVWCQVNDNLVPDVFLAYMSINGPRIVKNSFGVNCFNNTHRGYFKKGIGKSEQKLLLISLFTSFSQSIAELESKEYGSKTLKIEPSAYLKLPVIMPDNIGRYEIDSTFKKLDSLVKKGEYVAAIDCASQFIYKHIFKESELDNVVEKVRVIKVELETKRKK